MAQEKTPYQEQARYNRAGNALGGFGEGFGTGFDLYGPEGRAMGLPATAGAYSDEQIDQIINGVLDWDPRTSEADIQLSTKDGVVTLTGTVRNRQVKLAAGDDAWSVPSVQDVHNNINVKPRKNEQPSTAGNEKGPQEAGDEQLTHYLYDQIDANPAIPDSANVQLHVNNGVVTLTGQVPTKRAKHAAGEVAWQVPAVADVYNQLEVTGRTGKSAGNGQTRVESGLAVEKRKTGGGSKTS
ncbi:MAG: BON domain-containing protein [Chloroflexota bacterium]